MTRPEHFVQQTYDHLGNSIPDSELGEYLGVLFLQRETLLQLLGGCGAGEIREAELKQGEVRITWQSGDRCTLTWETVRQKAGLHHLPPPRSAFASGTQSIGLLLHSPTPHQGLFFREPHSLVSTIGTLTPQGLVYAEPAAQGSGR